MSSAIQYRHSNGTRTLERYVRVRPFTELELLAHSKPGVFLEGEGVDQARKVVLIDPRPTPPVPMPFEFHSCFWSASKSGGALPGAEPAAYSYATQESVFQTVCGKIAQNAVELNVSANVVLFGAANTGKNFTLAGDSSHRGILPLTLASMAEYVDQSPMEAKLYLSVYQVTHSKIIDILSLSAHPVKFTYPVDAGSYRTDAKSMEEEEIDLDLIERKHCLEGLTYREIESVDDAYAAVDEATRILKRAKTPLSAFAHTFYTISVDSFEASGESVTSRVHFVSLADSDSSLDKEHPDEAQYVSSSLDALHTVLMTLLSGRRKTVESDRVERAHELTRLMSDFFDEKNYRMVLLGTLSRAESAFNTNLHTLRFCSLNDHVNTSDLSGITVKPPRTATDMEDDTDIADTLTFGEHMPARIGKITVRQSASSVPDLLLVEDVKVSQRIASVALQRVHFRVEIAASGEEAIEKYAQMADQLRIILMDFGLPGMSGLEATRIIRQMERNAGRPPVAIFGLTGTVNEDDLPKFLEVGLNGCIAKGKLLGEAVQDALGRLEADPNTFILMNERASGKLLPPSPKVVPEKLNPPATVADGDVRNADQHPASAESLQASSSSASSASSSSSASSAPSASSASSASSSSSSAAPAVTYPPFVSISPYVKGSIPSAYTSASSISASISPSSSPSHSPLPTLIRYGSSSDSLMERPSLAMKLLNRRPTGVRPGVGLPSADHHFISSRAMPQLLSESDDDSEYDSGSDYDVDDPDFDNINISCCPPTSPPLPARLSLKIPTLAPSPPLKSTLTPEQKEALGEFANCDILLVEDVRVSQKIAQSAIQRCGFKVDVASDGESAVTKVTNNPNKYKVILMDIGLPGISGSDAAQQIRTVESESKRQPVAILAMTGNVEEESVMGYEQIGMNGCIMKGKQVGASVIEALSHLHAAPGVFVNMCERKPSKNRPPQPPEVLTL